MPRIVVTGQVEDLVKWETVKVFVLDKEFVV